MSKSSVRKIFNKALIDSILDNIDYESVSDTREEIEEKLYDLHRKDLYEIKESSKIFTWLPDWEPTHRVGYYSLLRKIYVLPSKIFLERSRQNAAYMERQLGKSFYFQREYLGAFVEDAEAAKEKKSKNPVNPSKRNQSKNVRKKYD